MMKCYLWWWLMTHYSHYSTIRETVLNEHTAAHILGWHCDAVRVKCGIRLRRRPFCWHSGANAGDGFQRTGIAYGNLSRRHRGDTGWLNYLCGVGVLHSGWPVVGWPRRVKRLPAGWWLAAGGVLAHCLSWRLYWLEWLDTVLFLCSVILSILLMTFSFILPWGNITMTHSDGIVLICCNSLMSGIVDDTIDMIWFHSFDAWRWLLTVKFRPTWCYDVGDDCWPIGIHCYWWWNCILSVMEMPFVWCGRLFICRSISMLVVLLHSTVFGRHATIVGWLLKLICDTLCITFLCIPLKLLICG